MYFQLCGSTLGLFHRDKTRWERNGLQSCENSADPHRAPTSTPSNTFGMNWRADCEPGLIAQHRCLTSLMIARSNGRKSLDRKHTGTNAMLGQVYACLYICAHMVPATRILCLFPTFVVHIFKGSDVSLCHVSSQATVTDSGAENSRAVWVKPGLYDHGSGLD